jgi:hypothetical protein
VVENEWRRQQWRGETALDLVRRIIRDARSSKRTNSYYYNSVFNPNEPPKSPKGTAEFLQLFKEGTYQHWSVSRDIAESFEKFKKEMEDFEASKKTWESQLGRGEKQELIANTIKQLEAIETALLHRNATTFAQLYPNIAAPPPNRDDDNSTKEDDNTFKREFNFTGVKDLTETRRAAYIEL